MLGNSTQHHSKNICCHVTDDGAYYFDEKLVDAHGHQSPLSASSAVVRGITAFATASDEDLNVR